MNGINILGIPIEIWAIIGPFAGGLIGAGLSGLVSWFTSLNRIKADLKASTRLEWIKEVRSLTSSIVGDLHMLVILTDKYHGIGDMSNGLSDEQLFQFQVETAEIDREIFKNLSLYKLYFSTITKIGGEYKTNEENVRMHTYVNNIEPQILLLSEEILNNKKNLYNPEVVKDFRKATSDYLKKEWDKAKENK